VVRAQLNTALTRATSLLVLVADPYVAHEEKHWRELLHKCHVLGCYKGPDINDAAYRQSRREQEDHEEMVAHAAQLEDVAEAELRESAIADNIRQFEQEERHEQVEQSPRNCEQVMHATPAQVRAQVLPEATATLRPAEAAASAVSTRSEQTVSAGRQDYYREHLASQPLHSHLEQLSLQQPLQQQQVFTPQTDRDHLTQPPQYPPQPAPIARCVNQPQLQAHVAYPSNTMHMPSLPSNQPFSEPVPISSGMNLMPSVPLPQHQQQLLQMQHDSYAAGYAAGYRAGLAAANAFRTTEYNM